MLCRYLVGELLAVGLFRDVALDKLGLSASVLNLFHDFVRKLFVDVGDDYRYPRVREKARDPRADT